MKTWQLTLICCASAVIAALFLGDLRAGEITQHAEGVSDTQVNAVPKSWDSSQAEARPTTHIYVPPPGAKIPLPPGVDCNGKSSWNGCNETK